ncbi:2,5-diamino-6-(ribosylamino)-4(3H)-pyrimidinone 5'-phosphate reductase [Saccharomycopsis crataegensis]|uniref:2,5-diamino-6-ribosylamino-4(3H)-pyrimidinone 5'-phosphate reductase n=1 Tax=Saccharomycopsis crataegensis TaxID=43959 RepID=A0AAV5QLQ6_9ASCO|nr:2,5-diamino-6-(ribosylamino)-4(3H)-pyrimidinone 5'-phosphate reductase [Saccharomycopsis crataegensis]
MSSLVPLDPSLPPFLQPYLPRDVSDSSFPFILLTWAQSLDSRISLEPGVQTIISSKQTKTMTHYIRTQFSGILIGIGTFLADDPGLNCRYGNANSIRPIIVDPHFRSREKLKTSRLVRQVNEKTGLVPIILIDENLKDSVCSLGDFLKGTVQLEFLPTDNSGRFNWTRLFQRVRSIGIGSVMVEGGGSIINNLLLSKRENGEPIIDAIVVTIGPRFLGAKGTEVSPLHSVELKDRKWWAGDCGDAVFAGRVA